MPKATQRIVLQVSTEEYADIRAEADAVGTTITGLIRMALVEYLKVTPHKHKAS